MSTIFDLAASNPAFSTLVTAVEVAGLVKTLQTGGPFTVFAPTNDAFAKLPPGTIQTLVQNPPQLARILTYHVVAGRYTQDELIQLGTVTSVEGASIPIDGTEGFEVKNATVIAANVEADNGIVHGIDNVILMG